LKKANGTIRHLHRELERLRKVNEDVPKNDDYQNVMSQIDQQIDEGKENEEPPENEEPKERMKEEVISNHTKNEELRKKIFEMQSELNLGQNDFESRLIAKLTKEIKQNKALIEKELKKKFLEEKQEVIVMKETETEGLKNEN
jgi:hypothetical protein